MIEEWRDIQGYEGLYQVSNHGKVRNVKRNKELCAQVNRYGYKQISLSKNNIRKSYKIHRLVAQAFLESQDGKPEVNHKSGDKTDNRVTNLEYCNRSENVKHSYNMGLRDRYASCQYLAVYNEKRKRAVKCITTGKTYESTLEAENQTGVNHTNISACCKGKTKSAGKINGEKLVWEYIDN